MWPNEPYPASLFCPWDFPGKNIGVGCYFLLQGILLTQGLNPCLLHLTCGFFTTEPPGKPRENYLRMKPTLWTSEAISGERNEERDEGMYRWKENEKKRYWTGRGISFYFESQYITSLFSFLFCASCLTSYSIHFLYEPHLTWRRYQNNCSKHLCFHDPEFIFLIPHGITIFKSLFILIVYCWIFISQGTYQWLTHNIIFVFKNLCK